MFEKKISAEISPEMNRKMTGNDIFRPRIEFFGHWKYISQFYPRSIQNAIIKCLGSTLPPRTVGGIVVSYRGC